MNVEPGILSDSRTQSSPQVSDISKQRARIEALKMMVRGTSYSPAVFHLVQIVDEQERHNERCLQALDQMTTHVIPELGKVVEALRQKVERLESQLSELAPLTPAAEGHDVSSYSNAAQMAIRQAKEGVGR